MDKLYCKENIKLFDSEKLSYTKGKIYTINYIYPNYPTYYIDINNNYDNICIFSLDKNEYWYIWKYFYTLKQSRKIKLDKLKNIKYE